VRYKKIDFEMIKSHISKVEKDRYMDIYPVFLDFFKDRELDRGTNHHFRNIIDV